MSRAWAASPPAIITYQGKLLVNSLAATTTQSMKFVLYNALTGGTALYTAAGSPPTAPAAINVTPTNGIFIVNLGDTGTNSLSPTLFQTNQNVFLEVTVGSEILSPRKQITAAPFAFNAKYLDGVAATSTASSSTYIPISDSLGNFNFNSVTSTKLVVTGTSTLATTTAANLIIDKLTLQSQGSNYLLASSTKLFYGESTMGPGMAGRLTFANLTGSGNPYQRTLEILGENEGGSNNVPVIGLDVGIGNSGGTGNVTGAVILSTIYNDASWAYAGSFRIAVNGGANGSAYTLNSGFSLNDGTVNNAAALYTEPFRNLTGGGSIGTAFGALISPPGLGSTQWTLGVGTGNSFIKGNLVVGASSTPGYTADIRGTLGVSGTAMLGSSLSVVSTSTFATATLTRLLVGTTTLPVTNYKVFIDSGASTTPGVGVNGFVAASGYITGSTTLDLAEIYPIDPQCGAVNTCPQAGDVVCLADNETVAACDEPYSYKMIGIVSTNPGFTLGGWRDEKHVSVALAGRVPLRVTLNNGSIRAGDRLTSSALPGFAQKATASGPTAAIALDDLDGSTAATGYVLAFVKLSDWSVPAAATENGLIGVADRYPVMSAVSETVKSLAEGLKVLGLAIKDGVVHLVELVAQKITAKEIETQKLCLDGTCLTPEQFRLLLEKNGLLQPAGEAATTEHRAPAALPAREPSPPAESASPGQDAASGAATSPSSSTGFAPR